MAKKLINLLLIVCLIISTVNIYVLADELYTDGSEELREEWVNEFVENENDNVNFTSQSASSNAIDISDIYNAEEQSSSATFYSSSSTSNVTRRYTVLVLDRSGSMITKPMTAMKTSALKFCQAVLEADGINYIAVVAYDNYADILCGFTTSYNLLQTSINSIVNLAGTNMDDGLLKADSLLSSIDGGENITKNILLLSDGLPNIGKSTLYGKYSWDDYWYFDFANTTYNTAVSLFSKGYYIYTLGFYHSIEEYEAKFAKIFMEDIQNAGYYEVTDPENLDFAFIDIADEITYTAKTGLFRYPGTFPKDTLAKDKYDFNAPYYYEDSYFMSDSSIYNPHLATMSLCLELSSWSSYESDSSKSGWTADTATKNVRELLVGADGIGFKDFSYNSYWNSPPTKNSIGAVAANKKVIDPQKNEYTLIALAVRGGGYYSEWASNFVLGPSGEHAGFSAAKENVLTFLSEYIISKGITGKIKLWIVGYSRGGAAANLVAGSINNGRILPNVTIKKEDLFAYTFEAPQGAQIDQVSGYHTNIQNIININDIVPLVAQSTWSFTRYNGSSYILPSNATSDFSAKKAAMLTEYNQIMLINLPSYSYNDYNYNIDEYTRKFIFEAYPTSINSTGDLFIIFGVVSDKDYPQSKLLVDTVDNLSDLIGPRSTARSTYMSTYQSGIEDIMDLNNSYYDFEKDWLNRVLSEFSTDDIRYIIAPTYSINPFYSSPARIATIGDRLIETFSNKCNQYNIRITPMFINSTLRLLAEYIFYHINDFVKLVDCISRGSVIQAHTPEVCLAWLRSQDSYYTIGASFGSSSSTYRIIRINCPVNVDVYDSTNILVASIIDDEPQDIDSDIICLINENYEKLIYLPSDGEYRVVVEAAANGDMTYSINEYSLLDGGIKRVINYYNLPLLSGDSYIGTIPGFSIDEIANVIPNGSTVSYKLTNSSNVEVAVSDDIRGNSVEYNYFDVIAQADCDGGFVRGSGKYLKGVYANVTAIPQVGGTFLGWYIDGALVSTDDNYRFAVKDNTILVAKFLPVEWHTLNLVSGNGGAITSVEGIYTEGTEISIAAEEKKDYRFSHWESANNVIFADMYSAATTFIMTDQDVSIIAVFEPTNANNINTDGGKKDINYPSGNNTGNKPINTGAKDDANTVGVNNSNVSSTGNGDGTVQVIDKIKYSVVFDTSGGSNIKKQNIALNGKVAKPADPKKDGFVFAGWYADESFIMKYDFNEAIINDITIYAKWTIEPKPYDIIAIWVNPFTDVYANDWYYHDVEYVSVERLFNGTSATTFEPENTTSRAMLVTVLWRLAGSPIIEGTPFIDVSNEQWYSNAVIWAETNDIVSGVDNGQFAPDDDITREQMATILYRYSIFSGSSLPYTYFHKEFSDWDSISDYAKNPVNELVMQGVINGKLLNTFDPKGTATRAEVAAMLHRFIEAII